MKYKLKKKSLVVFILFVLLTGIVLFEVSTSKLNSENNIVNKLGTNVSIGVGDDYADWEYGEWDVTTSFTGSGDGVTISEDQSKATLTSSEEDLDNAAVEITVSSKYNANSYDDSYYQLDLFYSFPLTIFETSVDSSYYYDRDSNKLIITDGEENKIGYVALGDIVFCTIDDVDCWDNFVPFLAEIVNGNLVVYNGDDIDNTQDYSADFTLKYSLLPSVITSNTPKEITPIMSFLYDEEIPVANLVTEYAFVEDNLSLDGLSSEEQVVYTSWNSNWGTEQSGYDYYIEYKVSGKIDYSQEYYLVYSVESDGSLLVYSSDGSNYEVTTNTDFNDDNTCIQYASGTINVECSFVIGYDLGKNSSFTSYFNLYTMLMDENDIVSAEFSWSKVLEKEVDDTVDYPSGTNKNITQTLLSDEAGIGALNKLRTGKKINLSWKVEPTADSINNTSGGNVKAFNLWNLTQEGKNLYTIDLETIGGYIDSSYNSKVNPISLTSDEYTYKSFYLLDQIEYDYVLNSGGSAYILSASDSSTNNEISVYVKVNDGDYELIGSITKTSDGKIVYSANNSKTTTNASVSESNPVVLPDNVTDIKLTYKGTKAAVYFGMGVNAELKSTDDLVADLNGLVIKGSDVVLKNEAQLSVDSTVTNTKLTGTYLTSAYETSTYYGSGSVVNKTYTDKDGLKYDSITYTDYVYEQVDFSNGGDSTEAASYFNEQKDVVIYELLPIGAELNGNVKVTTYGNEINCTTSVTETENYDGTGRTLLKIKVNGLDSNIYEGSTYLKSGYNISFDILYSYIANQSYGNKLSKDMAYYSNGVLTGGFKNASEASSLSFSSSAVQSTMNKLNTSNTIKNSVYVTESTTVDKVTVTVGTYVKEVRNDIDSSYASSTSVMESKKYKYRLKYVFSSDYEEITNLIFVDKIESSYGDNKYFKGYLDSIDTSYLNGLGVSTKIYYSTNTDVDLTNLDLTDISSWSTTKPSDITRIVAIAVSCGDYVFKGSDKASPMIEINMIATNEYVNDLNKNAYNSSTINYNYVGDSVVKTMTSDITTIELEKASIELDATTSVGTGTSSNPAIVEESFEYNVTLINSSTETDLDNVSFELKLPEGLSINTDDITEVSDNTGGLFGSYNYDNSSRILTYTLSTIKALETKNITIPVEIDFTTLSTITSFNATIQLKTLGNKDYSSKEIKLYNTLAVPVLEYAKYVDTNDTSDFTDEATSIIEKEETYTYRVVINNTSTIDAKDIEVVDNVPSGLSVVESSITNNGIYDKTANTITWKLDKLNAKTSVNLDYNVVVGSDITLGTIYRSSAHINVINPIDKSLMLYDDDTNIISTLYQIVSNIKVTNNVTGELADKNKGFSYSFEFSGDSSYAGEYSVVNGTGKKVGTLVLDSTGKGSYNGTLKDKESIEFKLLPNGITYTIRQNIEEGYTTNSDGSTIKDDKVEISSVTDEVKQVNYSYINSYSVSTTVDISAEVTYDKEITDKMFALTITDSNGKSETKYADEFGIVNFDTINYENVVGTFTYNITQVNTLVNKVGYDTSTYKVVVTLTNDGKGNLNRSVKYYNKSNEEVSDIVFNNEYVPNGLIINNVNTSDYVNKDIVFKYYLEISNSNAGNYVVKDKAGNEITELVVKDDGTSTYEFELKSDERITILDLPSNTKYILTQDLVDYYSTTMNDLSYTVDTENKKITHSGITEDLTIQIDFKNNYVTSGSFTPSSVVTLLEKELEEDEFTFVLKDVSTGLTNGYFEYITNTLEGELNFTTIEYTRPGTYVYEITQVKGDSNHIYYDLSKCILTVTLVDNGDSTMTLDSALYEYESGKDYFENTYSEEPIIPPTVDDDGSGNPNTTEEISKFGIIVGMITLIVGLLGVEKYTRRKRLSL